MALDPSSRARLNRRHLGLFPGTTLFDRLAQAVCEAECLPRKELYEAWEVARRVRRRVRGGRVVDLASGHGLLGAVMLLLDDTSREAVCVDVRRPASNAPLWAALERRWPRLEGRLQFVESTIARFSTAPGDVVVSAHACGRLSDEVLGKALEVRAAVGLLPCCHELLSEAPATLSGWMDGPLATDAARAMRLVSAGYEVWTQAIPAEITPKNRLLLARPGPAG